jgi:MalT-like TPR region
MHSCSLNGILRVLSTVDSLAMSAGSVRARGYQAQLLMQRALIANGRQQPDRALALLAEATELARAAGGNRILTEIALDAVKIQRERNQLPAAERTLRDGVQVARSMQDRLLLPRLLAQLADLRASQGQVTGASALLHCASRSRRSSWRSSIAMCLARGAKPCSIGCHRLSRWLKSSSRSAPAATRRTTSSWNWPSTGAHRHCDRR